MKPAAWELNGAQNYMFLHVQKLTKINECAAASCRNRPHPPFPNFNPWNKKQVPTSFPCWCDVKLQDLIAGLSVFYSGCVALRLVFGPARKETKSCWPVLCTVSHEESFDNIYNLPSLFVSLWFSRFSALEALLLVSMLIRCLHRSSKYTPPVW